jgi:hypothetical protein
MAKSYYKNSEKSRQKLQECIQRTYELRIRTCFNICKFLNNVFDTKSFVIKNEETLSTMIGFDDNSSLILFQTGNDVFGVPEHTLNFSKSHQFHNVIKYLCTQMYKIDAEKCEKIYIGDDLYENVDMDYVKSIYINDENIKELYWKKNQFQNTNMSIFNAKSLYGNLIQTKIKPLHQQARQCIELITQEHLNAGNKTFHIKSDLRNLALLCNHQSGTTWFNEFFINSEEKPNSNTIDWDLFWTGIDIALKNEELNEELKLEILKTNNDKFLEILQEIENCHRHITSWKKLH